MSMTDNDVVAGFWMFARVVIFILLAIAVVQFAYGVAGVVTAEWIDRVWATVGLLAIWVSLID